MYFYEICHSLRVAERVAVPLRSVRRGSRVKGWASNSELVKARAAAKFWLGVWHECDRPKSGVVNELRVYTKRRFAKELRKHRSSLKRETVSKIVENPNLVWKLRARPVESTGQNASDIDEEIWVDYFAAEFSPPDEVKNKKFSEELDQLMTKEHNYLMETHVEKEFIICLARYRLCLLNCLNFLVLYTNADTLLSKVEELKSLMSVHKPHVVVVTESLPKNCAHSEAYFHQVEGRFDHTVLKLSLKCLAGDSVPQKQILKYNYTKGEYESFQNFIVSLHIMEQLKENNYTVNEVFELIHEALVQREIPIKTLDSLDTVECHDESNGESTVT
ncbi:hypothetical protein QYM36_016083, partial [Artemia franciscana]